MCTAYRGTRDGETENVYMSECVLGKVEEWGLDVFRVHPKGQGVVCNRHAGLTDNEFVVEFFGEACNPPASLITGP